MQSAKTTQALADSRVNEADAKEADAAKRIRDAVAAQETAKELTSQLAQTRQEIAAAEMDAERVQARVRQLKADESAAVKGAQAAEDRRATAEAKAATAEARAVTAKQVEEAVRAAIEPERQELLALREERASIGKELEEIRRDRELLEANRRSMEEARAEFEEEKEMYQISADILVGISDSKRYARMNGTVLEVFASERLEGAPTQTMEVEGFAPWLPSMVNTYSNVMDDRAQAERTRKLLDDRYKALAEQYPEKGPELARQAAEDHAAAAAIAAQNPQNGFGG
jgi:chromosome segregation ATPase